jgi:hypothetical protein
MTIDKRAIWNIAIWVSVVVLVGFVFSSIGYRIPIVGIFHPRAYLTAILFAVSIITFFGFLRAGTGPNGSLDETVLRTAITVAVVSVYLILVSIVAFWSYERDVDAAAVEELAPLAQTMVNNFTTIVGVVIAFYFTSAAYVEGKKEETKQAAAENTVQSPPQE